MHELPLITTIAVAFTAAWLLGLITQRLGLSPIVGYLLAGVLIGPNTPGFVGDLQIAHQLAEVGVILLMFGVGLHFQLKDLLAVKSVAIPGAVGQSLTATLFGIVVFQAFGLPIAAGAVLGMAMAVASTVVLMRVLMDANVLDSPQGHVAVGWLLVEDVFTVVILVLMPVLGDDSDAAGTRSLMTMATAVAIALAKLAVLVAVVLVAGARVIPWVLVQVARLRSRELFTLTVLVFSIAIAAASYSIFGASMALGAFLAGIVVAQSPVSYQAAADALPLRDAFAVIFFVSVGMLFDPLFLFEQPLMILAALGIILLLKPLVALGIVALMGHSSRTALTVAVGLAQIGEFSFILSDLAREENLMPAAGHNVLVASAILSIMLNPMLFRMLPSIENWLRGHPRLWQLLNARAERRVQRMNLKLAKDSAPSHSPGKHHAIVVGFGPVGRTVHRLLLDAGFNPIVIDLNMDTIAELRQQGLDAVYGDASHESILDQAGMRHVSHLVLTLPHSSERLAVVTAARNLNHDARILVRARYLREQQDLESAGATAAVFEEAEVAIALARLVMSSTGAGREVMKQKVQDLRLQLILENMTTIHSQPVRTAMVPWTRVRRLPRSATGREVLRQIAEYQYSRWPVYEPTSGNVIGYLLAKDLIARGPSPDQWTNLVRPVQTVRPDDDIESILLRMQSEGSALYIVEDAGVPVGLITMEDILEQVVGRLEDEYPHEPAVSLRDAIQVGGVVPDLKSNTAEAAIREMAAAIADTRLPSPEEIAQLAIAREHEVSTDLGNGVAMPHARPQNLESPLIVVARSSSGIEFSPESAEPVRLIFLLVTPLNQPDLQLAILARLARLAGDDAVREQLLEASSAAAMIEIIAKAETSTGTAAT